MARRRLVGPIPAAEAKALREDPAALDAWKRKHLVDPEAWTAKVVDHDYGTCVCLDHTDASVPGHKLASVKHGGRPNLPHAGMIVNGPCLHPDGCEDEAVHGHPHCPTHLGT